MRYLLDTNVVSELRKRSAVRDPRVHAWAVSRDASDMALSVITVLEVGLGVARLARRDPLQAQHLRTWFDDVILSEFGDRTLPITVPVARRNIALHADGPRPERDAWIAATALVHGLTVVTRNVSDFAPTGVAVLNPWAVDA